MGGLQHAEEQAGGVGRDRDVRLDGPDRRAVHLRKGQTEVTGKAETSGSANTSTAMTSGKRSPPISKTRPMLCRQFGVGGKFALRNRRRGA